MNVSKIAKKGLLHTQTGTPYYTSPEVWKDLPYDTKSDIWSLGAVLYEICSLHPPFRAKDMKGLYEKVMEGFYSPIPKHYSSELANLIKAMLQMDPQKRPSCKNILEHKIVLSFLFSLNLESKVTSDCDELLNTIRVPNKLNAISFQLPKADYETKETNEDKVAKIKSEVHIFKQKNMNYQKDPKVPIPLIKKNSKEKLNNSKSQISLIRQNSRENIQGSPKISYEKKISSYNKYRLVQPGIGLSNKPSLNLIPINMSKLESSKGNNYAIPQKVRKIMKNRSELRIPSVPRSQKNEQSLCLNERRIESVIRSSRTRDEGTPRKSGFKYIKLNYYYKNVGIFNPITPQMKSINNGNCNSSVDKSKIRLNISRFGNESSKNIIIKNPSFIQSSEESIIDHYYKKYLIRQPIIAGERGKNSLIQQIRV